MATAMRNHFRWHLRACLLMVCLWTRGGDGYRCPYGENCLFEPAPAGQVPSCALPGLTYCLHPDPYPDQVIIQLIKTGTYDIRTLLSDESRDDFSATTWRAPPPRYGPPEFPYNYGPNSLPNTDQISLVDEPIYIPKPEYNTKFHNSFNQAFFSQKTPLHPPTAGDPYSPSNLPTFQLANFSALSNLRGYHSGGVPSSIWSQQNIPQNFEAQSLYNKKLFRQNAFVPTPNDYYNSPQNPFFNSHNYNPKYNLPSSGWVRQDAAVTAYNPVEWWRYVNPNSRSDVTIERSISLPPSSTVYYPQNTTANHGGGGRRRRRRAALEPLDQSKLTGAEALRLAFQQARKEVEEEQKREKRQSPNVVQLCQSRSQYITPRAALNNQGNWRYVVNMADNMTQLVKAEICSSNECNGICTLPLGYSSRCEQKYVQKRLVALQSNGQNLYTDVFWIPSCCQCTIMNN